jgi:predicted RecA/RadA family phage recombinase
MDALLKREQSTVNVTTGSARTGGEVVQCPDGRAGVHPVDVVSGGLGVLQTEGVYLVTKPTAFVYLAGQEIFWDHSANECCLWPTSDKDFFLGTVQKDTASTDLTCYVDINKRANCVFNALRDPARTVMVRTAGLADFLRSGGSHIATFSLTAEAQKMDVLSVRSVPTASKWIFQAVATVIADCDADVGDLSIGVASGTHASDADQIANSALFHMNLSGADLKIYAESDNVSAEVAATDTTKVFAVGTPVHLMIDGRSGDGSALAYYVNGVRVLSATALTLAGAAGPLCALFHLEKSSNDSPGSVALDDMKLWLSEDAAA